MISNQFSRYGAIAKPVDVPIGAKLFIVSDSDDTTVGPVNLGAEFPVDVDGVVRVYTTIQAAVNAATAGRGDVIKVLPGYDNTLGRTDSWNVAGVQIEGLGRGSQQATCRYTTKTDNVKFGANNVRVTGMRFLAATDSIAEAARIDSSFQGVRVDNCLFDWDTAGNDFRVSLRVGSRRSLIEDNRFINEDTKGCGRGISFIGAAAYTTIRRNYFYGQFDTIGDTTDGAAVIAMDTLDVSDTNVSGLFIEGNLIISTDTAAAMIMRMDSTSTIRGLATNNRVVSYDTSVVDSSKLVTGWSVKGGLRMSRNYIISQDSATEKLFGDTCPAN